MHQHDLQRLCRAFMDLNLFKQETCFCIMISVAVPRLIARCALVVNSKATESQLTHEDAHAEALPCALISQTQPQN